MVSSARQTIICILLVLGAVVCIQAQTTTQKVASASVSGKVTIKAKPAVGVMVVAKDLNENRHPGTTRFRARTDQTGNYRITNLPAGNYEISAIAPALVPTNQPRSMIISEGEEVEDVDISLVPGGVITGKITDSEREPLIGLRVIITPVHEQTTSTIPAHRTLTRLHVNNNTDDRGVYRVFGLPSGKYKVSAGGSNFEGRSSRESYKQTFYPSVTDAAKATIIEVTEGSETDHVDIVLGRPIETFRVAGRIVDGETGKPLPNFKYSVGQKTVHDKNSSSFSSYSGQATNANGEFRLDNLSPGTYTIFIETPDGGDMPDASVTFDIVDRDVTDLLLKTTKGSSLSGVVVLDGNERSPELLSSLRISAWVESKDSDFTNSSRSSAVGPGGTFSINGVRSGPAHLGVHSSGDQRKDFEIVRVERNGVPSETINIKEREHVSGLRVFVKYTKLTGAIRGQVKVENGELPPISQIWLSLWPLDENLQPKRTSSIGSPQLDARGRFFVEKLPAGTYLLKIYVYASPSTTSRTGIADEKTQQVTVTDDTVTEVSLIIKPQSNPN